MSMKNFNLEKPDAVFVYAPVVEDICIEFGIDKSDVETITCMYELYRRITDRGRDEWNDEAYDEGYREGYNDAIEEVESAVDSLAWDIGRKKKA